MYANPQYMGDGGFAMIKKADIVVKNRLDLPLVMSAESVSKLTHSSVITINRHCRDGKLKASKPSGEWMIPREMVQSIKQNGILYTIIVSPNGAEYEILSGHTRTNAAQLAGLQAVPR
jgi:pyridoxal/pyridoxine/pyridoxamine kinase